MAVCEDVKVLSVTGFAICHPVFPVCIFRYEDLSFGLVDDGPAVSRNDSLVVWFFGRDAVAAVKCPDGSEEIRAVVKTGMPGDFLYAVLRGVLRHCKCHEKVVVVEFLVSGIGEREICRLDSQLFA